VARVKILMHKYYAYVEFVDPSRAQVCVNYYQNNNHILQICGQPVQVYITSIGKHENRPLDLNPPSSILLCTFFKNKIPIDINVVLDIMKDFDIVEKVGRFFLNLAFFNQFLRSLCTKSRTFMHWLSFQI
jgi:hypothetical protein